MTVTAQPPVPVAPDQLRAGSAAHASGPGAGPPMLRCHGLRKSFGERVAVDGVGFEIAPGETYGLLGPNGAGKTTTISMICGLLPRDGGEVWVDGQPIDTGATRAKAADRLRAAGPRDLPGPDAPARTCGSSAGSSACGGKELDRRVDEVLELIGLADRAKDRIDSFSGGMKRRLNIGIGLLHRPKLLVLDEPTVGVDPQSRNAILSSIADLESEGMAILYTTHYMEEAERLCDRVGIIDEGLIQAEGTRRELVALVGGRDRVTLVATGDLRGGRGRRRAGSSGCEEASARDGGIDVIVTEARTILPRILEVVGAAGAIDPLGRGRRARPRGRLPPPDRQGPAGLTEVGPCAPRSASRSRTFARRSATAPRSSSRSSRRSRWRSCSRSALPGSQTRSTRTYVVVDLDGGPVARGLVDGPLASLGPARYPRRATGDRGRGAGDGRRRLRIGGDRHPGRLLGRRPGGPAGARSR